MKKENLTPIQYKQKVIHLQAEVSKYRRRVKEFEENYHYHLLTELKGENEKLKEKNKTLEEQHLARLQENKKLVNKITKLEEEMKKYKRENFKLKEEITKLIKQREDLMGEV